MRRRSTVWRCEVIFCMDPSDKRSRKCRQMTTKHLHSRSSLPPLCVNLYWLLRRSFTCKERRGLQGSFTDAGVSGFGDQRAYPEGVLMQTHTWGLGILRCPVIPSTIKGNRTPCLPMSPRVIEYLSCIWFVGRGGGDSWDPPPPRPAMLHPVIEARKCACHLLPLGHG